MFRFVVYLFVGMALSVPLAVAGRFYSGLSNMGAYCKSLDASLAFKYNNSRLSKTPLFDDGTGGIKISLALLGCWMVPLVYKVALWQWNKHQVRRLMKRYVKDLHDYYPGQAYHCMLTPENISFVFKEKFIMHRMQRHKEAHEFGKVFGEQLQDRQRDVHNTESEFRDIIELALGYDDYYELWWKEKREHEESTIKEMQEKLGYPSFVSDCKITWGCAAGFGIYSGLFFTTTAFNTFSRYWVAVPRMLALGGAFFGISVGIYGAGIKFSERLIPGYLRNIGHHRTATHQRNFMYTGFFLWLAFVGFAYSRTLVHYCRI